MQSQQIMFHIFPNHILFTMHFPSLAKTWIKYIHTEKLLKHDTQLHQSVDLENIEHTKIYFIKFGAVELKI